MVRWLRWHCPPDTGFEIRALAVWGRARYLSVTEAPRNTDFHTWTPPLKRVWLQTVLLIVNNKIVSLLLFSPKIYYFIVWPWAAIWCFTHKEMCKMLQTSFEEISILRVNPAKTHNLVIIEESVIYTAQLMVKIRSWRSSLINVTISVKVYW